MNSDPDFTLSTAQELMERLLTEYEGDAIEAMRSLSIPNEVIDLYVMDAGSESLALCEACRLEVEKEQKGVSE